jgi:hypothetical protein
MKISGAYPIGYPKVWLFLVTTTNKKTCTMRQKPIILLALSALLMASNVSNAQNGQSKYLLDGNKVKLSGFGGFGYEFSFLNGEPSFSSGGGGAFLFNYKVFAGFYGMNLISRHSFPNIYPPAHSPNSKPMNPTHTSNYVRFEHSGGWLGYIHNPNNLWHIGGSVRFGRGQISLYDGDISFKEFDEHHRDWVGVVTPELDLEVNLTRWFKTGMSLGYRMVFGTEDTEYTNSQGNLVPLYQTSDYSSPTLSVRFLFGAFGPRTNGKNGNQ